jgi:hypothetical protein
MADTQENYNSIALVISGFFMLVIAAILGYFLYEGTRFHREIRSWPSTVGVIYAVEVRQYPREREPGRYSFTPAFAYRYRADGAIHSSSAFCQGQGRQLLPPPSFDTERQAQGFLTPYRPGMKVRVYYNPDKPGESLLDPATVRDNAASNMHLFMVFLSIGIALLLAALFVSSYGRRQNFP